MNNACPNSQLLTTLVVFFLGCGGATTSAPDGSISGHSSSDAPSRGGYASSLGGATTLGGTSASSGSATLAGRPAVATGGHRPAAGGATSAGGTSATSTSAIGGVASQAAGGALIATGGTASMGGVTGVGGIRTTGGTQSSGGGTTGGRIASGGIPATGGTPAGGSNAAGSMPAAGTNGLGGSPATGGTHVTGGAINAAGSATVWPKKFCGNTTTGSQVDPSGLNFAKHWDQITPENEGKWGSVQSSASGAFNWTRLDAIYAYAEQNGLAFKEHTFVWGAGQPMGYSAATLEAWIKAFCERYPKTALIDVVNEPPPHTVPGYTLALGQGETGTYPWITKAFKLARQYCGNAVLILNDYNNIEYKDQEDHFIAIVKDIQAAGAPIDAVGAEAHYAYQFTASQLQSNLDRLATETGLPVYITEYDVNLSNDQAQRDVFAAQFPIFWNSSAVHGVTLWGWISGRTWMASTGLVTGTTPRPAMTWLMGYLGRPTPP